MYLRQVRYFVAVAKEKNFTRAAQILHISQPPLSRQIQLLEDELGVKLFARNARPLKLTEAGKVFYEQALQLLSRVEQMKKATRQVGKNKRRVLSIGFVPSMLYGGLPALVQNLQQHEPNTDIQLVEILSSQQPEALHTGRIDIAFGRFRSFSPGISRIILREERLMVALPLNHPLVGPEKEPVPLQALESLRFILYPKETRPNFSDTVQSIMQNHNLKIEYIQEVNELQTALGLVAAGTGISIVPVSVRILRTDLCYRLIGDDSITTPVVLSYRDNEDSDFIERILNFLEESYRENQPWIDYSINRLDETRS